MDPIQGALGGLSELAYLQSWIKNNVTSANTEVAQEANKLLPLYGTTGQGALSFGTDIGNESVVGGTESGTYLSIHADAGQAISEIELLNAAFPNAVNEPPALQPPSQDYGGLGWVPFTLPTGATGYWAPKSDGTYYYFGPDNVLYHDSYSGEVHQNDVSTNAVGNVTTYFGGTTAQSVSTADTYESYGGTYY